MLVATQCTGYIVRQGTDQGMLLFLSVILPIRGSQYTDFGLRPTVAASTIPFPLQMIDQAL